MNRRQLGFGLLTIFMVSLFFGSNTNTSVLTENKIEGIGETEVAPASDWVQGLGAASPTMDDQAAYLKNIADWLVLNAKPVAGGVAWSSGLENRAGYYDGVAGVISFLAKMYQTTKNATYLETARKAANWLQSGTIKVGTGKYKESDFQPRNYTGLESGSAGIGEAYLDLFKATGNQSYLLLAQDSAIWLQGIGNVVGEGMQWPYKEPIVATNVVQSPDNFRVNYGNVFGDISALQAYGGAYFQVMAINNGTSWVSDCEFSINTTNFGLYNFFKSTEEADKFLNYNMQITIYSDVNFSPNFSNVSYGGPSELAWTVISPSNVTTSVQTFGYATTQSIYSFVWNRASGSQFRVRVRGAYQNVFSLIVDSLNITLSYNDTAYYPDWSLGAAGIGQFFLDLYKATSNPAYYYTAANASRFLRDTAQVGATGLFWDKMEKASTTIQDGVAGIGKFLVDLYKVNSSDLLPLNLAIQGATWTIDQRGHYIEGFNEDDESLGMTLRIEDSDQSADYRSGYYGGMAGIGDFLLDLAGVTAGPNGTAFLSAANQTARFLSAYNLTAPLSTTITVLDTIKPYTYRWREVGGVEGFANGSQTGGAGNLLFLSRYASLTGSKEIGSVVDGGLRYLTALPLQTNFSSLGFYYYQGCAGLGDSLLQVSTFVGTAIKVGVGGLNYLLTQESSGRWASSSADARIFSGMYQGIAGVGLAMLEGYQSTGDERFLNAAIRAAQNLSVSSAHYQFSGSTVTYWGKGDGIAGIADFLLEMFVSTGNTTYRDWALNLLYRLLAVNKASLDNARWNLSTSSDNIYNNYRDGTAGIATTFLKAFRVTANSTYMQVAKGALVYLDSVDVSSGYQNRWRVNSGSTTTYTGWDLGASGIASAYLQAFQMTGNQSYLTTASGVALWLSNVHNNAGGGWYADGASSSDMIEFSTGSAGIVNFLLQLYVTNASAMIGNEITYGLDYLTTPNLGILTLQPLGWNTGLAGTLSVLSQAVLFNRALVSSTLQAGVQKLLTSTFREPSGAWHVNTTSTTVSFSGIANGTAGIYRIIATLPDISRPSLSIYGNVSDVNYDQTVTISINASDGFSNLSRIFLHVTTNSNPPVNIPASRITGDQYQAVIPAKPWATDVNFLAVAMDDSGQTTLVDNNSNYYQYTVHDHNAPDYSSIKVIVGGEERPAPAYGQNAKFTVVATEPIGASQVQSVVLYYSYFGASFDAMPLEEYPPTSNTFQTPDPGVTGGSWCYGNAFSFYFNITDYAGNRIITPVNNTNINDYTAPTINPQYKMILDRPEYPALTPFDITINVSNPLSVCESPLPFAGGAFIMYTTDGINWVRVDFILTDTFASYSLYVGSMPGQNMGNVVRFVLGAQDAAGNMAYMAVDKSTYTNFADIPPEMFFYFNVSMNWFLFFVVVGVVAAIVVFSYVIYMRRGGYWQRMRRSASAKATAISVQAQFASLYYWLIEKMQNFGVKLRKAGRAIGEKMEDFGAWAGEKVGERFSRFVRAIGRVIWDFLKGSRLPIGVIISIVGVVAINSTIQITTSLSLEGIGILILGLGLGICGVILGILIAGIGGLLKNFITRIRWYQVLLVVLFSLLLIIFPVIKWIMDQQYPLRAVFFMGMGITLFIGAFVVFIMNLIYQISYK